MTHPMVPERHNNQQILFVRLQNPSFFYLMSAVTRTRLVFYSKQSCKKSRRHGQTSLAAGKTDGFSNQSCT